MFCGNEAVALLCNAHMTERTAFCNLFMERPSYSVAAELPNSTGDPDPSYSM